MLKGYGLHKSIACIAAVIACLSTTHAHATTTQINSTPLPLTQALAGNDNGDIYRGKTNQGNFALSSSFYSGTTAGVDPLNMNGISDAIGDDLKLGNAATFDGDQRVYALLVDGSYDFNYDFGTKLPIHPYLAGGMGMAVYGQTGINTGLNMQNGDMAPLFRIGGGVTYRLGEQWDLSLDYKEGISTGVTSGDQVFTGRGNQPVDLHVLNMGMHYSF